MLGGDSLESLRVIGMFMRQQDAERRSGVRSIEARRSRICFPLKPASINSRTSSVSR